MPVADFLDSVLVEELETIPMELIEEFRESTFADETTTDYWGTTDFTPL